MCVPGFNIYSFEKYIPVAGFVILAIFTCVSLSMF